MKQVLILLTFFTVLSPILAQDDSDTILVDYKRPEVTFNAKFGATSNTYSTADFINFTSSDFLDEQAKGELLLNRQVARIGYQRSVRFSYRQPGYYSLGRYKRGYEISISNHYYNSARATDDIVALALFGNQLFEGETLELGKTQLETWFYSKLGYQFDVLIDSARAISVHTNLLFVHDHRDYNLTTADLYTARNGEYLDIEANYHLQKVNSTNPLNGMGLSVGASANWKLGSGKFSYAIENLGLVYVSGASEARVDSNFRFKGFSVNNLFELNDSILQSEEAKLREEFLLNSSDNYMKITPFRLRARYKFRTTGEEMAYVSAEYIHLAGFVPRATAGLIFDARNKQQVDLSVALGGFTTAGLNIGYRKKWENLQLSAELLNINGLIVPGMASGAIGTISLAYQL